MPEIKEGLNTTEASAFLGVSRPVVYALLNRLEHPLPSLRIGRRRIIPRHALMEWMAEETEKEGHAK